MCFSVSCIDTESRNSTAAHRDTNEHVTLGGGGGGGSEH